MYFRIVCRSDDESEAEEEKKPVVVVANKPLSRVKNADCTEKKTNVDSAEPSTKAKKMNKKVKNNVNATEPSTTEASTSEASTSALQSVTETKVETNVKMNVEKNVKKNVEKKATKPEKAKPVTPQKQPSKSNETGKTSIGKFAAKHKNPLKKVAFKTIDKKTKTNKSKPNKQKSNGLSDERLKAFGINPKKFNKKQNYVARNKQQIANKQPNKKSSPQAKQKSKFNDKLKMKLKKALQWANRRVLASNCQENQSNYLISMVTFDMSI